MSRVLLTFVAGAVVGVGGLVAARPGHDDREGPAARAISAVDIDEEVSGKKAGDALCEPATASHAVSRNPSDRVKTRVLAVLVHPRDVKELVTPSR